MARRLVIETEVSSRVPDFAQTSFESDPSRRACAHGSERPLFLVRGLHGVARKQMLQIRENQLLMLLFVIQSEFDERANFGGQLPLCEHGEHGLVDVLTIRN